MSGKQISAALVVVLAAIAAIVATGLIAGYVMHDHCPDFRGGR